jgi:hypothetical protein
MINYNIIKVDSVLNLIQIQYTRSGYEHYYVQQQLPDSYDDAYLHSIASAQVEEAQEYWDLVDASSTYTPSTTTGELKELVLSLIPEYDVLYQSVSLSWTETATTKTKVWTINNLSDADKALNIRIKRNALLEETDTEALSDRTLSSELTAYRESLRGITDQETFPTSVIWPTKPLG